MNKDILTRRLLDCIDDLCQAIKNTAVETGDKYEVISQLLHYIDALGQSVKNIAVETEEYNLFSILKPKLFIKENQWCCLYGNDIETGIAGFGESPYASILNWSKQWYKKISKEEQ